MPLDVRDRPIVPMPRGKTAGVDSVRDPSALADLLADRFGVGQADLDKLVEALAQPGLSRAQQVDIVRAALAPEVLARLAKLVDDGLAPLSSSDRVFLAKVVSLPAGGSARPVDVQAGAGRIEGAAPPGAVIEAINLSAAPAARLHTGDALDTARADDSGRFLGALPDLQPGDIVRLRARSADGKPGPWVTVRATGGDTRGPVVALPRLGLLDEGEGTFQVFNYDTGRPISEPGARIRFTNQTTGERFDAVLDDDGQLPANLRVKAKPGDALAVAASDGVHNVDLSAASGQLVLSADGSGPGQIDLPDPPPHGDEVDASGRVMVPKGRVASPLFDGDPKPEEVVQGMLADCYFAAAAASIARANPGALKRMFRENPDGTVTVTFKELGPTGRYRDVEETVDRDLYRSWGTSAYYGRSSKEWGNETPTLWWPILEKALAQRLGGYDGLTRSTSAKNVFESILGRPGTERWLIDPEDDRGSNLDDTWRFLKKKLGQGLPVAAGTYGSNERYVGTAIHSDHFYSVLGLAEKKDERVVVLRNPWGDGEPPGDGVNDGIFELKLEDFAHLFLRIASVE